MSGKLRECVEKCAVKEVPECRDDDVECWLEVMVLVSDRCLSECLDW